MFGVLTLPLALEGNRIQFLGEIDIARVQICFYMLIHLAFEFGLLCCMSLLGYRVFSGV